MTDTPLATPAPRLSLVKTDQERAEEFKARLVEAYQPLLAIMDEIVEAGMIANVQTGPNAFGKHGIVGFSIFKKM